MSETKRYAHRHICPEPSPAVSTANERKESLIERFKPVFELLDIPTGISPEHGKTILREIYS